MITQPHLHFKFSSNFFYNFLCVRSIKKIHSGVFVRIKDKNLHVECFKCATCGSSLKNQGYYNLNNKLYCDVHARLAAMNSPPPNANGLVPVTYPPWVWIMMREFSAFFIITWKMTQTKARCKNECAPRSFCLVNIFNV